MPRFARLPSNPFGYYYVALRSVPGRKIVTTRAELATVLKILRESLRDGGAKLHAAYVGEREVHLALRAGEGPLSAIIGSFQHEGARVFNRIRQEHGSLFRRHHHVLLIQHQRWLVPLVHYIHWIGRLKAADDYPGSFWWTSDEVYRKKVKQDWVTTNVVLRMLTHGAAYNRQVQDEAYRALFDQEPEPSHARSFKRGSKADPRILGDTGFIAEMWRHAGRSPAEVRRACQPEEDIRSVVTQGVEQFNMLCAERLTRRHAAAWKRLVTYENVCSRSRKRPLPMVRALSVSYLIEHQIATATQAARLFRCSPRSVSARRRCLYKSLFHELFGAKPEILFCPHSGNHRNGEVHHHADDEENGQQPGRSEASALCDCP